MSKSSCYFIFLFQVLCVVDALGRKGVVGGKGGREGGKELESEKKGGRGRGFD